jgi:hypothetical protein
MWASPQSNRQSKLLSHKQSCRRHRCRSSRSVRKPVSPLVAILRMPPRSVRRSRLRTLIDALCCAPARPSPTTLCATTIDAETSSHPATAADHLKRSLHRNCGGKTQPQSLLHFFLALCHPMLDDRKLVSRVLRLMLIDVP